MPTNPYYSGPSSDHFDGKRFCNPGQPATDRSLQEVLRWRFDADTPATIYPGRPFDLPH